MLYSILTRCSFPYLLSTLQYNCRQITVQMDLGKFCIDQVEIFPVTTLYFSCRNVKFSQHTHGETWKRFSDGEREAWEAAAILFYPLLLYSIHTRCSFPYFHGVSKYYRVHESCLDCGAAILSSCEWDSAEPARASLFWVIFFQRHESCCLTYFKHCMKLKP